MEFPVIARHAVHAFHAQIAVGILEVGMVGVYTRIHKPGYNPLAGKCGAIAVARKPRTGSHRVDICRSAGKIHRHLFHTAEIECGYGILSGKLLNSIHRHAYYCHTGTFIPYLHSIDIYITAGISGCKGGDNQNRSRRLISRRIVLDMHALPGHRSPVFVKPQLPRRRYLTLGIQRLYRCSHHQR